MLRSKVYQINLDPVAWSRAGVNSLGKLHFYDPQHQEKMMAGLFINKCHGDEAPFPKKPVAFDIVFYMPIPKTKDKKVKEGEWCICKKDLDNLVGFLYDACVDAEILCDDNIICKSSEIRIYSKNPRTMFTISELI